jgi:DNA-binding MarR family transcriptional regulator
LTGKWRAGSSGDAARVTQPADAYRLDEQIGFILRKASQRHAAIFAREIDGGLTPTQFSALVRLHETGDCSQNRLGRLIAVDAATIKGVVERLQARGLVETTPDMQDRRRITVSLNDAGRQQALRAIESARRISELTLEPLDEADRRILLRLLSRIA